MPGALRASPRGRLQGMSDKASRLDTFVAPRPNRLLIALMAPVNRVADAARHSDSARHTLPQPHSGHSRRCQCPPYRLPDGRPRSPRRRSAAPATRRSSAPNHPEFFTDWMIDKEISSRGRAALRLLGNQWRRQRSRAAGAALLARQQSDRANPRQQRTSTRSFGRLGAAGQGRAAASGGSGRLAWRLRRAADARRRRNGRRSAGSRCRHARCSRRFGSRRSSGSWSSRMTSNPGSLPNAPMSSDACIWAVASRGASPAERVFRIYEALLRRDEEKAGVSPPAGARFAQRLGALVDAVSQRLSEKLPLVRGRRPDPPSPSLAARAGQGRRTGGRAVRAGVNTLQRLQRLGPFAWQEPTHDPGTCGRAPEAHPQRLLQGNAARHAECLRAAAGGAAPRAYPCGRALADERFRWLARGRRCTKSGVACRRNSTRSMPACLRSGQFRSYPNPFYATLAVVPLRVTASQRRPNGRLCR